MPDTLPGLLILAGIVIFVISHFGGSVSVKEVTIPGLKPRARKSLRTFAMILMATGFGIFSLVLAGIVPRADTLAGDPGLRETVDPESTIPRGEQETFVLPETRSHEEGMDIPFGTPSPNESSRVWPRIPHCWVFGPGIMAPNLTCEPPEGAKHGDSCTCPGAGPESSGYVLLPTPLE